MKLRNLSIAAAFVAVSIVTISNIDSRGGVGHSGSYHGGTRGYGRGYGAGAFATGVALGTAASAAGNDYYDEEYSDYSDDYEPEPAVISTSTKRGFDNPLYNNETQVGHEYGPREFYYHKAKDSRR